MANNTVNKLVTCLSICTSARSAETKGCLKAHRNAVFDTCLESGSLHNCLHVRYLSMPYAPTSVSSSFNQDSIGVAYLLRRHTYRSTVQGRWQQESLGHVSTCHCIWSAHSAHGAGAMSNFDQ